MIAVPLKEEGKLRYRCDFSTEKARVHFDNNSGSICTKGEEITFLKRKKDKIKRNTLV